MKVLLYQPKIKRTVMSLLEIDDIDEFIKDLYDEDVDMIPLNRKHIYRVAVGENHLYVSQKPSCWQTTPDGENRQLILGDVLFIRKNRRNEIVDLTDSDVVYITLRYRPYNFHVT